MSKYKIVLEGANGVGKTRWIQCLLNNSAEYTEPTQNIEVNEVIFETNYGDYTIEIWERGGLPQFRNRNEKFCYDGADAVIILTDSPNDNGILSHNYGKKLPRLLVYNGRQGSLYKDVSIVIDEEINLYKPFQVLLRMLTKHGDLVFKNQ